MALKISQLTALSTTYKDTDIIEVSVDAGAGAFVTRKMTFLQLRTAFTKLEANLDVNSFQITSASNGNIIIRPNGSGAVLIGGNSTQATELRFMEDSDNGTNYVALKVAAALAASTTYTLPSADGTSGQVLSTNGSGTLSWATAAGGGGLTVGTTAVTSGTVGRIFFQGSGDVVQQDSTLFWDNTNKRLGVGATPSTSVRLDVRAQGALSTDIAFRVRNSADTYNIFTIAGDGTVWSNGTGGGIYNTAFGEGALDARTTGNNNTAFGVYALSAVTTGNSNTAFGIYALLNNTGSSNTAIGSTALQSCTSGGENTALGESSLGNLTTGTNNVGIGGNLNSITTAVGNTALGRYAGVYLTSGNSNVFLGREAGARYGAGGTNLTTCGTSVLIGYDARTNGNSETNQIVIGDSAIGLGTNTAVLGNSSIVTTQLRGNVISGNQAALATNATDGFLYIPSCAGTPTGTPTAITGKVPMVADTTNNKLYIYVGGAWTAMN